MPDWPRSLRSGPPGGQTVRAGPGARQDRPYLNPPRSGTRLVALRFTFGKLIMSLLVLDRISKRFNKVAAVDGVSFTVGRGEVVGFLGPNGAGKSTTMRMITQYLDPDEGTILFDG